MFLRKSSKLLSYILFLFLLSGQLKSNQNEELIKKKLSEYLLNTKEISSSFIQINDDLLQEGNFYLKNNRLRIEYKQPNNIIIIVKNSNAMYYNVDLKEVQYFNPKNTVAELFFNLFYSESFLDNADYSFQNNSFSVKKIYEIDGDKNSIEIYFEQSPLKIRKIELNSINGKILFGIIDLNYNPDLDNKLFSLANPLLS
tara:strand:- start:1651 stop:2247 length:597 start_codon:yes stop_codon:yes gene_type:complete